MALWSDEDIEMIIQSLLLLLAVSLVVWYFFGPAGPKPDRPDGPTENRQQQQQQQQQQIQRLQQQRQQQQQQQRRQILPRQQLRPQQTLPPPSSSNEDGIVSMLATNGRRPPHASEEFSGSVAHEGVVPFRFTTASVFESRTYGGSGGGGEAEGVARQMANRKDRARIFTKLFSSTRTENTPITQPPSRGSNVVLTVPSTDVDCPRLRKVLFLLGSYYNLFLMVALDQTRDLSDDGKDGTETQQYVRFTSAMERMETSLRGTAAIDHTDTGGGDLPPAVLPSHRIVGTTSVGGRVAFVRQLPKRPEFVLEYDGEVKGQLTRFGFAVLSYERRDGGGGGSGVSGIGTELIS